MDNELLKPSEIKVEDECVSISDENPDMKNFIITENEMDFKHKKRKHRKELYTSFNHSSKSTWQEYLARENSLQTYHCPQCSFETKWRFYLRKHIKKIHATPDTAILYKCSHCLFKSRWKFSLINHFKIHKAPSQVKMYKCEKCDYKSKWKAGIACHMKVHLFPKIMKFQTYKCGQCIFECKNKQKFMDHRRVEHGSGDVTYSCPLCSFTTRFRHGVNKHVKVHNMNKFM